jgi:DNA-binding protein HU-beta
MNKTELSKTVAVKAGLTQAQAKKAVDAAIEAITEALKTGDKVALIGFGTFSVAERPEREGINPLTTKMPDLNCFTVESAMSMVAGTARSMGITVTGESPLKK